MTDRQAGGRCQRSNDGDRWTSEGIKKWKPRSRLAGFREDWSHVFLPIRCRWKMYASMQSESEAFRAELRTNRKLASCWDDGTTLYTSTDAAQCPLFFPFQKASGAAHRIEIFTTVPVKDTWWKTSNKFSPVSSHQPLWISATTYYPMRYLNSFFMLAWLILK